MTERGKGTAETARPVNTIRMRLSRTVRDTVIKLTRVARAALHRWERARVSYAVGPFGTSRRDGRLSRT